MDFKWKFITNSDSKDANKFLNLLGLKKAEIIKCIDKSTAV